MKLQNYNQLVYTDEFGIDHDSPYDGVFPKGARDKNVIIAPAPAPFSFVIGGHRYLFKQSVKRHPIQFWIELVAYRLGVLVGVSVPPAFVAYEPIVGTYGALIEWFYGHPGSQPTTYYDGGVYMMRLIRDYDLKYGEKHNFLTIAQLFEQTLPRDQINSGTWRIDLAKILAFDALIGNTDRHHDNWGILLTQSTDGIIASLSPAFDNGTSMGYEIFEENFHKFNTEEKLMHYIGKGTHHLRWHQDDTARMSHSELLVKLVRTYPDLKEAVLSCLIFDEKEAVELLFGLCNFDIAVPFTAERAKFCLKLLFRRREVLEQRIGAL